MSVRLIEITKDHYTDWKEITGNHSLSQEQFDLLLMSFEADQKIRHGFYFLISDMDQIVGSISLFNISWGRFKHAMLDYSIKARFRRKGYAFEGLKLIERFASNAGLRKLLAYVEQDNEGSKKLLLKCHYGYRLEENALLDESDEFKSALLFWKILGITS